MYCFSSEYSFAEKMAGSKRSLSVASKSGLTIPPSRIRAKLKATKSRVSSASPVFVASIVEFVLQEVILKAVEITESSKGSRISAAIVMAATRGSSVKRVFDGLTLVGSHTLEKPGDSILTAEAVAAKQKRLAASKKQRELAAAKQ